MNAQSVEVVQRGLDTFARGMAQWRARKDAAAQRESDAKAQIERESREATLREKLQTNDHTAAMDRVRAQIDGQMRLRDIISAEAANARAAGDNPGGMRGDLLAAEVEAARARAAQVRQQTTAGAPSTLAEDLAKTDEWSREMFRAQQVLQQAQAAGDAEAVAVAQGRLMRLQRMGEKYGSEKPEQRMVKVRVPFLDANGKEAGFREWSEPYDPKVHQATPQPPAALPALSSMDALRQKYGRK